MNQVINQDNTDNTIDKTVNNAKEETSDAKSEKSTSTEDTKPVASEESAVASEPESVPADTSDTSDNSASEASTDVEIPAKFKTLVEQIETMTVLELNELVKLLEKKFGVSAAAVAVAGPGVGAEAEEEKTVFNVELSSAGDQKIKVIKAVKDILGLGLKEAKDLVDGAPSMIKEGVNKEEAGEIKAKIEEVGGKIELK